VHLSVRNRISTLCAGCCCLVIILSPGPANAALIFFTGSGLLDLGVRVPLRRSGRTAHSGHASSELPPPHPFSSETAIPLSPHNTSVVLFDSVPTASSRIVHMGLQPKRACRRAFPRAKTAFSSGGRSWHCSTAPWRDGVAAPSATRVPETRRLSCNRRQCDRPSLRPIESTALCRDRCNRDCTLGFATATKVQPYQYGIPRSNFFSRGAHTPRPRSDRTHPGNSNSCRSRRPRRVERGNSAQSPAMTFVQAFWELMSAPTDQRTPFLHPPDIDINSAVSI